MHWKKSVNAYFMHVKIKFKSFPVNTIFFINAFAFRAVLFPCQMHMHSQLAFSSELFHILCSALAM